MMFFYFPTNCNAGLICKKQNHTITEPVICVADNIEWVYNKVLIINNTKYDEYISHKITGYVTNDTAKIINYYDFTNVFKPIESITYFNNFTKDCFINNSSQEIFAENQITSKNVVNKGKKVLYDILIVFPILPVILGVSYCVRRFLL